MFYSLIYTINGVQHTDDCLPTALLADRINELSREHDRGEGHYVCILAVTPLTASLDVYA